jgi:hypothetical protein
MVTRGVWKIEDRISTTKTRGIYGRDFPKLVNIWDLWTASVHLDHQFPFVVFPCRQVAHHARLTCASAATMMTRSRRSCLLYRVSTQSFDSKHINRSSKISRCGFALSRATFAVSPVPLSGLLCQPKHFCVGNRLRVKENCFNEEREMPFVVSLRIHTFHTGIKKRIPGQFWFVTRGLSRLTLSREGFQRTTASCQRHASPNIENFWSFWATNFSHESDIYVMTRFSLVSRNFRDKTRLARLIESMHRARVYHSRPPSSLNDTYHPIPMT